jgi:hypothetical protein
MYSIPPAHGYTFTSKSKSKLYYDQQLVGQSVLLSGTHLGPVSNFSPSFFDYFLDSCGFVDLGHPLWWEDRSVRSVSSYIMTDVLLASKSWCCAQNGAHNQILIPLFDSYDLSSWRRAASPISPMNRVIQPEVKVKRQGYVSVGRNF